MEKFVWIEISYLKFVNFLRFWNSGTCQNLESSISHLKTRTSKILGRNWRLPEGPLTERQRILLKFSDKAIENDSFKQLFPVVYTWFRGWGGGVPGGLGGTFLHWKNKKFRVFSNSKIIKKCLKNQWKFYNF